MVKLKIYLFGGITKCKDGNMYNYPIWTRAWKRIWPPTYWQRLNLWILNRRVCWVCNKKYSVK